MKKLHGWDFTFQESPQQIKVLVLPKGLVLIDLLEDSLILEFSL